MNVLTAVFSPTRNRRLNELIGLSLWACALLALLALASYHAGDPSWNTSSDAGMRAHNWIGLAGAFFSDLLLQLFGVTAFFVPIGLAALGLQWLRPRAGLRPWALWTGAALWFVFVPAVFALLPWHWRWMHATPIEGLNGRLLCDFLVHYLNFTGTALVCFIGAGAGLYLASNFCFATAAPWAQVRFAFLLAWRDRFRNWRVERKQRKLARHQERQKEAAERRRLKEALSAPIAQPVKPLRRAAMARESAAEPAAAALLDFKEELPTEPLPVERPNTVWNNVPRAKVPLKQPEPPPEPTPEPVAIGTRADATVKSVTVAPRSLSGYKLPPSTLLHRSDDAHAVREDELREQARVLVEKYAEFDVTGQVTQINPGPVVTTYEFKPEAGVKYSRVVNLAEDLCLAMQAESILIERMAGKSTVGIQVPNRERETIWLRDMIESEQFAHSRSRLTIAMGKDINGRIVTSDLAVMPHVMIAGSTGSGKSVAINAMIMSLLYKATPAQVRLILVDPKRVELGMYDGVPHLFTPIITEPKLAANALRNAVREMERRLKLLASRNVRNLEQYNKLFDDPTPNLFPEGEEEHPLPYIVIIIDELADLMMLDKINVEASITRLAQMARAVGIHLVLATQRPSVDVITGLIKANVPARASFRLATKVDSRTIIDSNGAESLLGKGDMLFLPPGTSRLQRVHAPFVTEKEISAVVDFWKEQGSAEYVTGFLEAPRDESGRDLDANPDEEGEQDEMFEDAVRLVLEFGKASTSLLQRRLRIGYGRAAHLIDLMERDGIVGPADGPRPREVLKSPDWLAEVDQALR